jgi:signal transduction histidine kinase
MNTSPAAAPLPEQALTAGSFVFRPWRTLGFALVVALAFALLSFALTSEHPRWQSVGGCARALGMNLVFALTISFTIDLLYAAGRRVLGPRLATLARWQRALFHWGTPMVGLAIALPLAALVTGVTEHDASAPQIHTTPLGAAAFALLVTAIFYGYFALRVRQWRAEREAAQAQLKLLQAQMEPHFLFNTLANVIGLIDADAPRAKRMLESFTDYLRASLASLREAEHTLGAELDLVEAYLQVVQVRMDARLRYRIDVPEPLRTLQLPTLSVQPLVENAIVHGLEPKIDGGEVVIAARLEGGALRITVTDDGLGLDAGRADAPRGTGTALRNIRARLAQVQRGQLLVEPVLPLGVRATLILWPTGTST